MRWANSVKYTVPFFIPIPCKRLVIFPSISGIRRFILLPVPDINFMVPKELDFIYQRKCKNTSLYTWRFTGT